MRVRKWVVLGVLGVLAYHPTTAAQQLKTTDVIGAWKAEVRFPEGAAKTSRANLVLWPDGLWWFGGPFMADYHGGARWRLVGDTLWLGTDYVPYFHPMIEHRIHAINNTLEYGLSAMDTLDRFVKRVISRRPPYPVSDSVYWSKAFRDTTSVCADGKTGCGTYVYKVSRRGQQLHLVRLDNLSQGWKFVVAQAVLTRDTLLNCQPVGGTCD
jgi:hypothetical protein